LLLSRLRISLIQSTFRPLDVLSYMLAISCKIKNHPKSFN
jgi:hypothetical protein